MTKCLGYTENYKHCPTCLYKDGKVDGKAMICYFTKYVMAKPCPVCGGYYPGDCRCPQPCYCDSCNTQKHLDEELEEGYDDGLDDICPSDYW